MRDELDLNTGYPYYGFRVGRGESQSELAQARREFRVGFKDPLGVEWADEREAYGELRTILLAMADGVIFVVAFAERNDRIRIISVRRATRREQDHYYRENGA